MWDTCIISVCINAVLQMSVHDARRKGGTVFRGSDDLRVALRGIHTTLALFAAKGRGPLGRLREHSRVKQWRGSLFKTG